MILVFDKKKILNCFIVKDYWVICWFKLMIEVNVCLFRKKMGKDMFSLWFMNVKRSKYIRNKFK